jgi:predicted permease
MRLALRAFSRNPGFAALCVLSLAAGIGLAAALASVADAILFRPLPVPEPERMVRIFTSSSEQPQGMVSYRDFEDFRRDSRSIAAMAAETQVLMAVGGENGGAASVRLGLAVTADYFDVLQVRPALGRSFRASESRQAVVVLADALWRSQYGADRGILGRSIQIGGVPFTVLGIAPKDFGLDRFVHESFYVAVGAYESGILPGGGALEDRSRRFLSVYGRLARGSRIESAQAELSLLAARLETAHAETNRGRRAIVLTEFQARTRADRTMPALTFLLIAMAIVLLAIAAANAGGLLVARAEARGREIAVRMALGATAPCLLADFLIEAAMLTGAGTALGIPMAAAAVRLLARTATLPTDFPFAIAPRIDARVMWIAALASALTTMLCGCAPALAPMFAKTRTGIARALRHTGPNAGSKTAGNRAKGPSALVAIEVALATALVAIGAGLMESVKAAAKIDPGYRTGHVLVMVLDPSQLGYSPERTRAFYRQLPDRVRTVPGVRNAALAQSVMLGYTRAEAQIHFENEDHPVFMNTVTPEYFDLLHLPILAGRGFDDRDTESSMPVAIVNQELAKRYGGTGRMRVNGGTVQIVGVARNAKYFDVHEPPRPYLYLPFSQHFAARMVLHVETWSDPAGATRAIVSKIREIDAAQPVSEIRPLRDYLEQGAMFGARIGVDLAGSAGACAITLALAGIYGVISQTTARRRREIGIRMALGARRVHVVALITRHAMGLIAIGAAGGIAAAAGAARILTTIAPGSRAPGDQAMAGWSLAGAAAVALTGVIAALVPALRGSAVDPASALRQE